MGIRRLFATILQRSTHGFHFHHAAGGAVRRVEPLTYLVDISSWQETLLGEHPAAKMEKALGSVVGSLDALTHAYREVNAPAIRRDARAGMSNRAVKRNDYFRSQQHCVS
ncbi:hypothetical protein [Streptomyces sp. NPDC101455]|uniref:hypothetical protein n=1 Tax=Streptomyces sp. NPDC101455 TaxID=3366142 RepID=UPI0038077211